MPVIIHGDGTKSDGLNADQVDGKEANAFPEISTGTWTPTVTASSGSFGSITIEAASYTKIGRLVHAHIHFRISDVGTASGQMEIDNFPFSTSNSLSRSEVMGRHLNTGDLMVGQFSSGRIASLERYDGASVIVDGDQYILSMNYQASA